MHRLRTNLFSGALTLLIAIAAGCGGGGGGASLAPAPVPNPPPTGGVDRGGVAVGTISGFGSIIVNGVHYATTGTQFTIDDNPGSESDLAVGLVVTVVGTITADGRSGTASTVVFENDVEGPVQSIDLQANVMVVAGQIVRVNDSTVFDDGIAPGALGGLAVGDRVQISGFFTADGELVATRIEHDQGNVQIEVKGSVSALDASAMTFAIGQLNVDYSTAVLEDFTSGGPQNGDFVEVKGTTFGASGELVATRVQKEDNGFPGDDGDNAEIEGFVTAFTSIDSFSINGRPVVTTASTVYEHGTSANLALNVKIEAEGSLDANGVLVASKIEFKLASSLRVEAPVDNVDVGAGIVTVLGLDVAIVPTTQLEDDSDANVTQFSIANLAVGDYVEVRGATDATGAVDIVATRLERDNPDDKVKLRGFVDSIDVAARSLVILGITVVAEPGNAALDAFLASVTEGALVEAEGIVLATGVIQASEFEFEDD